MLTEKSFNTGEIVINYAEGPEAGPPLVLLHGATMQWKDWNVVLPNLTEKYHVYALDLRGHGKSGRAGDQYHIRDFAGDVVAFVQQVVREPAVLIGHSLGAITTIAAVPLLGEQVRGAVVLDPPLLLRELDYSAMPWVEGWLRWVLQFLETRPTLDQIAELLRAQAGNIEETHLRFRAETLYGNDPRMIRSVLDNQMLAGFDFAHTLQEIKCPVLLVHGEWNAMAATRDEDAVFFKEHVPQAKVLKIPNAPHSIHTEYPDLVLRYITEFLESLPVEV